MPARARSLPVAGHWVEIRGHAVAGRRRAAGACPRTGWRCCGRSPAGPGGSCPAPSCSRRCPGAGRDEHAVETAMARLRAALGDPKLIQTVVKRGYRLALDPAAGPGAGRRALPARRRAVSAVIGCTV